MAVEIPVYIDIEGAAKDAAKRAPQALEVLESALDKKALKVKIQIDKGNVKSVNDILSSSTMSAKDLLSALKNVEAQIGKLSTSGNRSANTKIRSLTSAYEALRVKFTQLSEAETRAAQSGTRLTYSHDQAASSANRLRLATIGVNDELSRSNSWIAGLIKNSLRLVAIHSATTFIRNVRDVTAQFELQQVALGSIIQDTERASSLFRQIKAAAIESPFEIKDLVTYTKQLSAYQIETEKLFDTTMKLADVSAGLGVDMSRLILAYGQVRAASVLRGQELRQFTEAGIPLVEKLAEKFTELNHRTVTTAEVFELISKRAVPFRMIEEIFNDMTSAGGMFYKMQEKQAETLLGQWNNLKDAISIMYDEIGRTKTVHNAMTTLISDARWLMQNWRSFADVIKVAGSGLVAYVAITKSVVIWDRLVVSAERAALSALSARELAVRRVTAALIGETATQKLATKAATLYAAATMRAATASTALSRTIWNLTAALASNPFGIAAVAIGALVGYFIKLSKSAESADENIDKANRSMQELSKARENSELIRQYEELSKKTNLTAKETAALRDISRELAKVFPKATEKINEQTGALILNIEQMKEYSASAQELIKSGQEAMIKNNEALIDKYEKRAKRIENVKKQGYGFVGISLYYNLDKDTKLTEKLTEEYVHLEDEIRRLKGVNDELRDSINGVVKTADNKNEPYPPIGDKDKLNGLRNEISLITDAYKKYIDLLKYMSRESALKNIDTLFPSLKGMEPTLENTIARITGLSSRFKGADAERVIEQAVANIRFDALKKQTDDELQRISDEIKRSETAKNFFKNILDLTGDQDLATNLTLSVYGGVGEDFKDRLQKELFMALKGVTADQLSDELKAEMEGAITTMDSAYIKSHLNNLPDNIKKVFQKSLDEYDKYNAGVAKDYVELLVKYQDIANKRTTIEQQADQKIKKLRKGLNLELERIDEDTAKAEQTEAGKAATARVNAAIEAVNRERDLELLRNSRDYHLFFETIGSISLESARKIAKAERDIVVAQFEAGQISLSQYNRELDRIEERLKKYENDRNPLVTYLTGGLDAMFDKFKQESRNLVAMAGNLYDDKGNFSIPEGLEKTVNLLGRVFGGEIFGVSGRKNVFEQMKETLKEQPEEWERALNKANAQIDEYISDFQQGVGWAGFWVSLAGGSIKAFDQIAQKSKNTEGEVKEGWNKVAKFIMGSAASFMFGAPISGGVAAQMWYLDDAWERFTGLNEKAMSGFEKFKSGDIIGAIVDNVEGWMEVFDKNTKKIDRQIKEQSDSLEALDYQYKRLETSIQKAFGSDYIADYNKQLDVLYAKQAAYEEQARLEESKDKKKDQSKIDEYNKSARDVSDQIADMLSQISEFFAGTDLTSAAKDFASAWIDAYKQFGSTTDAMKEKFQDMIQEMITNSLAAKVMQDMLDPIFKQIDTLAQEGGELSAQDIAAISAAANALIPNINAAMTTLMSTLGASGYDIRRQAGQFTGISRSIAGASEESITGLAAGIATQNMYMSYVPIISANVAAIVTYLTGDATQTSGATPITPTNSELMMSHLDSIDSKLANILDRFESVLTQNSGSNINRRSIAVRMI